MDLTEKQKELLNQGKEKGYITLQDSQKVYSSEISRKGALNRLMLLGFIKEVAINKFEVVNGN